MKPRSLGNTADEDELVDSEDEEELPDFVSQEASPTASDNHTIEIQEVIDNLTLDLGLSNAEEAEVGPIFSLHDLESQLVILEDKPQGDSQNIFDRLGDLRLGKEPFLL